MFTIDGHSDTMLRVMNDHQYDFFKNNIDGHLDLPRLRMGGVNLQIMALFIEPQYKPYQSLARTIEMCGAFHRLLKSNLHDLLFIKGAKDLTYLETNKEKVGLLMALEGGEAITNLNILESLYALGLRLVTLTWNQRNLLADGVGEKDTGGGLTLLGKEMVAEMDNLGILVDVSHLSEHGFWDVAKISRGPFVASHSNAYQITPHPRNLKDEQITAIVEKDGIIGINFLSAFLTDKGRASIDDVLRHIDYITSGWGFDNIGLGTDYDGIEYAPVGLEDVSRLTKLKELLISKYGIEKTKKIMGANWKRVLLDIFSRSC